MTAIELQETLRTILGWRVGDQTADYILSRLASDTPQPPFPILAHDARTGHPIRPTLDPRRLAVAPPPKPPAAPAGQMLLFPTE